MTASAKPLVKHENLPVSSTSMTDVVPVQACSQALTSDSARSVSAKASVRSSLDIVAPASNEDLCRPPTSACISNTPAGSAEDKKPAVQFSLKLWIEFIEIARLHFYDGPAGKRRTRAWFSCLVVALFLGVIGCTFWASKCLVVALAHFDLDSFFASRGVEATLDSPNVQGIASAFIVLAIAVFYLQRKQIQGKGPQWRLLGGIFFFNLCVTRAIVLLSYILSAIENALHDKDEDAFTVVLLRYGTLLASFLLLSAVYRFARLKFARHWRNALTKMLVKHYMAHKTYYHLDSNSKDTEIDNPDQRLTQDADHFTEECLVFSLDFLNSLMNLVAFAGVLWGISAQLTTTLVGYAAVGNVIAVIMGTRLIVIHSEQLRLEADLRYSCIRVRENAESIAFYDGENLEQDGILHRLKLVLEIFDRYIRWATAVETFTQSFFYMSRLVPYISIAPLYFQGKVEFGTIAQSQIAFMMVLNSLDFIIRRINNISKFAAGIHRLSQFYEAIISVEGDEIYVKPLSKVTLEGLPHEQRELCLEEQERTEGTMQLAPRECGHEHMDAITNAEAKPVRRWGNGHCQRIRSSFTSDGKVEIVGMTLLTPTGRTLLKALSCSVSTPGLNVGSNRLLVVGPSGTGKSSLLRAIAGLWKHGVGQLHKPPPQEMMFLPQKPYMPLGNLRAQLIYPRTATELPDEELTHALSNFKLGDLPRRFADGYDSIQDWSRVLSLGEQQRIAAARCLLFSQSLRFVVLDEATSALPVTDENVLYGCLKDLGVGLISVGHRDSLVRHHDRILRLHGDGGWELLQPEEYVRDSASAAT